MKTRVTLAASLMFLSVFAAVTFAAPKGGVKPIPAVSGEVAKPIDGDMVWKQQCGRCHITPGVISRKRVVAVSRHMRDVGQLTDKEYRALLEFLTKK